MQGYYIVTETIKAQLELDPFVNTVNTGIIEDVLLKKADMYPYSHILVNNSSYQGNTWMFNLSVICMDIVDLSKDEVTEVFYGNDNQQDVLNTQLAVINRMLDILQRGQNTKSYILDGAPNCEPFIDRFEHGVAGWTVTFDIRIPNTMTVCSTDVTPVKLCPDFTYLIKDSADNTLYTGSILSGNGLTQTITDGEVTNSLGTVLGNVLAQGSLELPDVNNIDSDGSTVPTPAGVAFTCTPSSPPSETQTTKTGQTVSYTDYDDGFEQFGREVDFYTLSENNPFGNTLRFTGTTGTGTIQADTIMLDWAHITSNGVYGWSTTVYNGVNFLTDIANAHALTVGGLSNWFLPNKKQVQTLENSGTSNAVNWSPLNCTAALLRTCTTDPNNSGNNYVLYPGSHSSQMENKLFGNPRKYIVFRIITLAELGL